MTRTSTLAPSLAREEHNYPPVPAIPEPPSPRYSLRNILRLPTVFAARRRRRALQNPTTSNSPDSQVTEFGATTPATTSSDESWVEISNTAKPREKSLPPPAPPIVIPSIRWTAEPQTFTVRVEPEFTVTCTVVQPVARCRWRWPTFSKFRFKFNSLMPCLRRRSEEQKQESKKSPTKAKRKSRGGIAVEMDVLDDAPVEPERRERQQQTQQERRIKAARRNSGWAGVFSSDAPNTSANANANASEDENRASFEIDRTRDRLVVPDVAIGIAYSVKEELEEAVLAASSDGSFGLSSFDPDSEESWLDLS